MSVRSVSTLHKLFSQAIFSQTYLDNIAQEKIAKFAIIKRSRVYCYKSSCVHWASTKEPLYNVALEAPDNNAQKQFLCSVALILYTQFVIFKPLSYNFEEIIGFDVKAWYRSCPMWHLIRWYNKPGDITMEFWEKAIHFHGTFHGLKLQTTEGKFYVMLSLRLPTTLHKKNSGRL